MPYDISGQEYELNTKFPIYYLTSDNFKFKYCIEDTKKHEKILKYLNVFLQLLQEKFPNSKFIEFEHRCVQFKAVPYIRFIDLKSSVVEGVYNLFDNCIIINTFNDIFDLEKTLHVLFHEYGHFIYKNNMIDRNDWLRYYINNIKQIDKSKLDKLKLLYITKWENPEVNRNLISKIKFLNSEYNLKRKEIFVKPESDYQLNEEEIFCETFATYMTGKCLYKSNEKIIRKLLNESISQSKGSILQYW